MYSNNQITTRIECRLHAEIEKRLLHEYICQFIFPDGSMSHFYMKMTKITQVTNTTCRTQHDLKSSSSTSMQFFCFLLPE